MNILKISAVKTFKDMSKLHYENYIMAHKRYYDLYNDPKGWVMGPDRDRFLNEEFKTKQEEALISIVFMAMAVEAFINEYAIMNMTQTCFDNYFEKIDLKAKWVIIPRVITEKEFPVGNRGFELLSELVSQRNNLVHSKTQFINMDMLDDSNLINTVHRKSYKVFGDFSKCEILASTLDELIKDLKSLYNKGDVIKLPEI